MTSLPGALPPGFDRQLDRVNALVMDAFRLANREEILSAGRAMGLANSDGTIISTCDGDNARVIEWTAFHIRRNGKALIQILGKKNADSADSIDRDIFAALVNSAWGIYRVEDTRFRVGAVVTDLWRQQRRVVHSRAIQDSLQPGDSFMARLIATGSTTTVTALVSPVSAQLLEGLRTLQAQGRLPSDALIAQDLTRQEMLAEMIFAVRPSDRPTSQPALEVRLPGDVQSGGNRQRNQPCHCGSGRKFKVCCGRGR